MILFNMFAFFFLSLFSCCSASGYFELQLLSVENIRGELSNGDCCAAGPRNARKCLTECATILRVCLKQYQSQVTFTDRCTFGNKTSGILGGNSFSYALNTTNSILKIPFEFSWTVSQISFFLYFPFRASLWRLREYMRCKQIKFHKHTKSSFAMFMFSCLF